MTQRLLGDLASITVGHVGPMADEYQSSGVPFLRSLNVRPFRIDLTDIRYISSAFHSSLKKSALSPGDVVVVRTGEPGTAAVIPEELEVSNCSDLVVIRPGRELDSKFLCYYMNGAARGFVDSRTVGAVQQHFNVSSAREIPMPDLNLEEQQVISNTLGSLDALAAENRRQMENILRMSKILYGTLSKAEGMDVPLGSLCDINPTKERKAGSGVITYLPIGAVGDGFVDWPEQVLWLDAPAAARLRVSAGDVIWSRVRPNRRSHALLVSPPDNTIVTTGMVVLRPKAISAAQLFAITDSADFSRYLSSKADGTTYPTVDSAVFETAKVRTLKSKAADHEAEQHSIGE